MPQVSQSIPRMNTHDKGGAWNDNTAENPFYKYRGRVEVVTKTGQKKFIECPACVKGFMPFIVKWRSDQKPK
jgi:hypothetical protein